MRPLRTTLTAVLITGVLATGSYLAGVRSAAEPRVGGFDVVLDAARELSRQAAAGVSDADLAEAAIQGMLEALEDPYAAYLSPAQQREVNDLLGGSIVGIGVWLEVSPEGLRITSLVDGTPAVESGLRPGDVIVEADGHGMKGLSLEEAARFLQGPEGTSLEIEVLRGDRRFPVTVERAEIEISDVQGRMLDAEIAYVRVLQFGRGVAEELGGKIRSLLGEGARGVILDLRGNSGGIASEAIDVASLFLGDGVVARVRERGETDEEEVGASGRSLPRFPMAVLVDGGTASASEVVVGALQDRERATIVGTRTYGKGSVLAVSDLSGDASIQYTTAYFLTPQGRAIEGRGLEPDVAVLPGGDGDPQLDRALAILRDGG